MILIDKYYIDCEFGTYFNLSIEENEDIFGDVYYSFTRVNEDATGFMETANTEREAREMMNSYIKAMYWEVAEMTGEGKRAAKKLIDEACAEYMDKILEEVYE